MTLTTITPPSHSTVTVRPSWFVTRRGRCSNRLFGTTRSSNIGSIEPMLPALRIAAPSTTAKPSSSQLKKGFAGKLNRSSSGMLSMPALCHRRLWLACRQASGDLDSPRQGSEQLFEAQLSMHGG